MRPGAVPLLTFVAALAVGAGGCSQNGKWLDFSGLVRPPVVDSGPTPDSPAGTLRRLEWCFNRRALSELRELFTADFRFFFSPLDSAGAAYRGTPWTRSDELISTARLFGGSANPPSAISIYLALDRSFLVYADPRFTAWDPEGRWHKNIRTQVVLHIQLHDGSVIDISGAANFYFVRGDSAAIPADLVARGFGPDSTRWWINRWDDETAQAGGSAVVARTPVLATQPSRSRTWGSLKVVYR
jgi:hypothetical protein